MDISSKEAYLSARSLSDLETFRRAIGLEHGFGNPGSPKDDIGSYEGLGKFKGKSLSAEKLVSTLPRVVCRAEF